MLFNQNRRGYACIGLDNPKNPANIGSAIRAVGVYDAAMIAISGKRYKRARTDTMKHYRHIPLLQVDNLKTVIPYNCVPIAVDLINGAIPLPEYNHPERAFYVFGAEDATLGKRTLSWCRDVIYIPTNGCMNLAATVNVVLYDRIQKRATNGTERLTAFFRVHEDYEETGDPGSWTISGPDGYYFDDVTHWQPLPGLPVDNVTT